jgi:hypothetical protein
MADVRAGTRRLFSLFLLCARVRFSISMLPSLYPILVVDIYIHKTKCGFQSLLVKSAALCSLGVE